MDKSRFNHSPFVHSVWVKFNGWRFKNPYLIRTKDGEEILAIPNGGAWCTEKNIWVEDADVTHIQALPDGVGPRRSFVGSWRIGRDIDYFGKKYPVWCGTKDGFVHYDEIPAGKAFLPVRFMAHRSKKYPEEKITFFITQAILVDASTNPPTLDGLTKYAALETFWDDDKLEIMSHNDLINAIHIHHRYLELCEANPTMTQDLIDLFKEVGIPPKNYIHLFAYSLRRFGYDHVDFRRQLEEEHLFMKTSADNITKAKSNAVVCETARNALRGPEYDQSFTIDMLELSNFLKNPAVKPARLSVTEAA